MVRTLFHTKVKKITKTNCFSKNFHLIFGSTISKETKYKIYLSGFSTAISEFDYYKYLIYNIMR